jgi:photosynthetic reaction center cytochrome c subunit
MKRLFLIPVIVALASIVGIALVTLLSASGGSKIEATKPEQLGYRGVGMVLNHDPKTQRAQAPLHAIPEPEPPPEIDPANPPILAKDKYLNIQVLTDLNTQEFSRLMQALTVWVSPEEGCAYCHNPKYLASDEKYPKVVARHMLQMTRNINEGWKKHVGNTGVTCYTCHRGQPVPSGDWFEFIGNEKDQLAMLGHRFGQNHPGIETVGNTSLPYDPLTIFLKDKDSPSIRVQGERALAGENRRSVKQSEHTYGLMIYMSQSLGVNCTFCHNTRAAANWEQSSPQRVTAWYGIRMVRDINSTYLHSVGSLLPLYRMNASGDYPKVACATCHKGVGKPLNGISMLNDYPALAVEARLPYAGGPRTYDEVAEVNPFKIENKGKDPKSLESQ